MKFIRVLIFCLLPLEIAQAANYTFESIGTVSRGTGGVTAGTPGTWNTGSMTLIFSYVRTGAETVSTPAGYTDIGHSDVDGIAVFCRIKQAGDTIPSIDWSGSSTSSAVALSFAGGFGSCASIVDASATATLGNHTNIPYTGITVANNNELVLIFGKHNKTTTSDGATINSEPNFTEALEDWPAGNGALGGVVEYWIQTTKNNIATDALDFTGTTESTATAAFTIALNPTASAPTFSVSPAIGTRTTSSIPVTATTACTDCNYYGVAVTAGSGVPTCTQVKAGQNSGGTSAYKAFGPIAMTTTVQNTGTFSTYTDGTVRDGYFCLNSTANGDSAVSSVANMYKIPAFTSGPTFSSCGTGGCTYSFTLDGAGTVYGVACKAGSTAATVTQVEAGQCTGAASAQASANTSGSSLTIGSALTLPEYDFALVGTYGSQHEASTHADTSRLLTAPSTCGGNGTTACQYLRISSIGTGSPCESFNTATNPDIAANDVLKAPATTNPSAFSLTIGTDCQFSYSGDGSRQDALNIGVYDFSVQAFHADDIDFWSNNQAPIPPEPDSIVFYWMQGVPITPIDLTPYCTDPEGDTLTVTAVSGLAAGLSITANVISGTPSASGISVLTLRCADITGASVEWQ